MTTNVTEAITGGVVLAVAAGFLVYSSQFGGFGGGGSGNAMYTASFRSAEGVGIGTDVRLAGVKVGSITSLELDPTTFRAEAALSVDDAIVLCLRSGAGKRDRGHAELGLHRSVALALRVW